MAQMAGTSGAKPKPREEGASIFPARQRSKVTKDLGRITENAVFLNIPYDQRFRSLYLAYIAGLVHLGFLPRVTLALPSRL